MIAKLYITPVPLHRSLQSFRKEYLRLITQQAHCFPNAGHAVRDVARAGWTVLRLYLCYLRVMRCQIAAQ